MKKRRIKCFFLNLCMYGSSALICVFLAAFIGYIFYRGIPYISIDMLCSKPSLIKETIGIFPNIINTVYIILITLIISMPLGVGSAVYLNEYASNKNAIRIIEFASEILSGIPSVIYGLIGMLIFVQFFSLGTSLAAGGLTMAVMTLPTVIRTTQESLKAVPNEVREGAFALGAGKWYAIRTIILPSSMNGIITGCILAIGRITGESAALLFTSGMANEIMSIFESFMPKRAGSTLTVALYMYAKERGEFDIAFAIAFILIILTMIINFCTKLSAGLMKKEKETNY